ncbi:hypothetical protein AO1008_06021 [Aspergillus oryzae 100-8]|uniref:Uncharacterized protein n=1 Tax=Aspergillus oryzae (strain 3.042) TaxID=1160506 RepID=I8TVA3_ASPO3|nr:hypothetical protein Ao3042_05722 [Aspergillus oryzae 3.042]KDE79540.1 hypothetical protein AO1008_06021 [Aspergillus oryzae 100-8]KOC11361.1 hypothetical protein AFLA70_251g001101 [Aspergillus flavus AF70]|eukprot:EIT78098.1 hypothetical protein Ao3042_05722 [Aspergillus oryzae 3.042]
MKQSRQKKRLSQKPTKWGNDCSVLYSSLASKILNHHTSLSYIFDSMHTQQNASYAEIREVESWGYLHIVEVESHMNNLRGVGLTQAATHYICSSAASCARKFF